MHKVRPDIICSGATHFRRRIGAPNEEFWIETNSICRANAWIRNSNPRNQFFVDRYSSGGL
ncbi:hypothetical protein CWD77_00655 [Rhodohalobacter barkolensis]|uniref:Uncharacterized protein n=1 Tax=Rhodohalobacter barkolensis TaxID=2053187 RepID=A0A2N0VIK4_9BACT|nr:hypothetical protein CWD77_00655 [Rhodohalobacter barkolensis]